MGEWNGSGPSTGMLLSDDHILIIAKVLGNLRSHEVRVSDGGEFQAYLAARTALDVAATDIIHESRARRR